MSYHSFLGGLIGMTYWETVWITEEQKDMYSKEREIGNKASMHPGVERLKFMSER